MSAVAIGLSSCANNIPVIVSEDMPLASQRDTNIFNSGDNSQNDSIPTYGDSQPDIAQYTPQVIYHIIGSGELPLSPVLVEFLESENFIIRTHDAMLYDIPDNASTLFITMPAHDWEAIKEDRIHNFLNNYDNRAFFAFTLDTISQAYRYRLGDYIIVGDYIVIVEIGRDNNQDDNIPEHGDSRPSITQRNPSVIYHVIGSGELPLPLALVEFLESENFIIRTHNAMLYDIPETADALFITMPAHDWEAIKADRIFNYLNNHEGSAFLSLVISPEERFPRLDTVLQAYGLRLGDYAIVEEDMARTKMDNPTWIVPMLEHHEEILLPLVLYDLTELLFLTTTAIEVLDVYSANLLTEPLLITSDTTFGRLFSADTGALYRIPDDIEGPFHLAVAVTNLALVDTASAARLVVVASDTILHGEINHLIGSGNWAFISASLSWLLGH